VCAHLRDIQTFTALVNCLCNFLEEHNEETSTTNSPILPKTRPTGELKALQIMNILLPENISSALEAGIVSRWLSKYPFPCASSEQSRKQDVVILMKTWWSDDAVMSSIFGTLTTHPDGIKQLRKFGLMGSMIEENDHDDDDDETGTRRLGRFTNPPQEGFKKAVPKIKHCGGAGEKPWFSVKEVVP
jgi:hypothetical protein